jgi:hypothetical protein
VDDEQVDGSGERRTEDKAGITRWLKASDRSGRADRDL